jgi:molecular chaperone DnaJ
MNLPISFAQAALGADIEVPTLFGKSNIRVPSGTQNGHLLRLKGLGLPDLRGGHQGDCLFHVLIEVPKKLTKKQEQLLRDYAETEAANVLPAQKTFLEKLKGYVVGDENEAKEGTHKKEHGHK